MVKKVGKGMATKSGAMALARGPRYKAYLKTEGAFEKATEHAKAVKASFKGKPYSEGRAKIKKAEASRKAALDKWQAATKLWKTDPFDPDPDSYYRSNRHYKGGKVSLKAKNRAGMGKTIKSKTTKRKKG